MDVKEAVAAAKTYIAELLADEGIINLGLEEVDHDDARGVWLVTLGFSRPWHEARNAFTALSPDTPAWRSYRVVTVR